MAEEMHWDHPSRRAPMADPRPEARTDDQRARYRQAALAREIGRSQQRSGAEVRDLGRSFLPQHDAGPPQPVDWAAIGEGEPDPLPAAPGWPENNLPGRLTPEQAAAARRKAWQTLLEGPQ